MLYITGDMHGDFSRIKTPAVKRLRKGDFLFVCGDFGFIWNGGHAEQKILKKLDRQKFTLLFVEGVHENFDLLEKYEVVDYCGGKARKIGQKIYQLLRGYVFTIEGRKFFAFGGGESRDRELRAEHQTWWPQELATPEELQRGLAALKEVENEVDYIITHEAPSSVDSFIDMDNTSCNPLQATFDEINRQCKFRQWYFGYYHLDKVITNSHTAVFREVLPLG